MVRNKKVTGTAASIPVGLCIGTAAALVVTLVGALVAAWLIETEKIGEEAIGYCSMVILMAASMLGAFTAQALIKHQRLIICAAAGACYYLTLLAMTALFFGGQYTGMGVTALVIAGGTAVIILLGLKGNRSHHPKIKKHSYG